MADSAGQRAASVPDLDLPERAVGEEAVRDLLCEADERRYSAAVTTMQYLW